MSEIEAITNKRKEVFFLPDFPPPSPSSCLVYLTKATQAALEIGEVSSIICKYLPVSVPLSPEKMNSLKNRLAIIERTESEFIHLYLQSATFLPQHQEGLKILVKSPSQQEPIALDAQVRLFLMTEEQQNYLQSIVVSIPQEQEVKEQKKEGNTDTTRTHLAPLSLPQKNQNTVASILKKFILKKQSSPRQEQMKEILKSQQQERKRQKKEREKELDKEYATDKYNQRRLMEFIVDQKNILTSWLGQKAH